MKPRATSLIALLAAFALGSALFARAPADSVEADYSGKPEIVAATFASAWCASCKILKPKLAKVVPAFAGEPVAFIEFDFTFGERKELRDKAAQYGLDGLYERNKGATGFTMLVDRDTGDIIDTLTMNFSEGAMRQAIARAIAIASHTDEARTPAAEPGR